MQVSLSRTLEFKDIAFQNCGTHRMKEVIVGLKKYFTALVNPAFARPSIKVALIVGTMLLLINHGATIWNDQMTPKRWFSAVLTYVVPYLVSIHGKYSVNNK